MALHRSNLVEEKAMEQIYITLIDKYKKMRQISVFNNNKWKFSATIAINHDYKFFRLFCHLFIGIN